MQTQSLDLDQLLKEEKPIFVVNRHQPIGIVIVQFKDGTNIERVIIPKTTHPFNLSQRVPVKSMRESFEFRRFIQDGVLELIDPDVALNLLKDPDIQEELRAAIDRTNLRGRSMPAQESETEHRTAAVDAMKKLVNAGKDRTAAQESRNNQEVEEETPSINTRVQMTVQRLQSGDLKVKEALADLKAIATDLSREDFSYITSQVGTGHIASWAKRKLERLEAEDAMIPQKVIIED